MAVLVVLIPVLTSSRVEAAAVLSSVLAHSRPWIYSQVGVVTRLVVHDEVEVRARAPLTAARTQRGRAYLLNDNVSYKYLSGCNNFSERVSVTHEVNIAALHD